jgi:methanethiol S-methyltransferase
MLAARRSSPAALLFAWCGAVAFAVALIFFLHSYLVRFGEPARLDARGAPVAANVLLFSIFALHHSFLARTGLKTRVQRLVGRSLERSLYTWTASLLFLLVCWYWQPVPGTLYHLSGLAAVPGYALQGIGLAITARASAKLDVLDLAGVRAVLSAGGRDAAPPPALETEGLYGLVRHPVYLAWFLFVFGAPHMTMTRLVFAFTSTAYLAIAIPFEERSLIQTFGPDYRAYRQRVRWRMIPGVY